jgi:soluble lytic murein transglycosylase
MAGDGGVKKRAARRRKNKINYIKSIAGAVALIIVMALIIALTVYFKDREYVTYPLYYRELIELNAAEFSLDPAHVAAVILCESGFREKAVSVDDARGLMQIIPQTGEWIAGKLGAGADFDPDDLYKPEFNVRLGCWYLGWLMDRYDNDMRSATAAYHAGQGKVDQWLMDSALSDDGATLKTVPQTNRETAKYVIKVLTAYEKYRELYDFGSDAGPSVGLRAESEYRVASSNRYVRRWRDHGCTGANGKPV